MTAEEARDHITWKRTRSRLGALVFEYRSDRGAALATRAVMRRFPHLFTVDALHRRGLTVRGKTMKRD